MKTLDMKSLLIGGLATLFGLILISGTLLNEDPSIEFVPYPEGIGIYNQESETLYLYKQWNSKLSEKPFQTLTVSDDGKTLIELK